MKLESALRLISLLIFLSGTAIAETSKETNGISYKITIDAKNPKIANVKATFIPQDNILYMFSGANDFPRRWASFVSDISLTTADNQKISLTEDGAQWLMENKVTSAVTLKYKLNLEHDKHRWSGGVDGAAYSRDWGVFYTSRSLFITNGKNRDNIKVSFSLPEKWHVTSPWQAMGNQVFNVTDLDTLATSMFFAGLHEEFSIKLDGFELLFAIGGQELIAQNQEFKNLAEGVLEYYTQLMGGVPKLPNGTAKSVVIINPANKTDGEAIGNNISILIDVKGDEMSKTISRFIFAHEFFHLWNGKSFAPQENNTEWFKEGFSNYYTLKSLHHVGFLNDDSYLSLLADFFYQKYDNDDGVGKLSMTDGELKHDHWGLIYSGGFFVAIAQDMIIRKATNNEKSIDDLMKVFFHRYSMNANYRLAEIQTELSKLSGIDQQDFFKNYINGVKKIPLEDYLLLAGINTALSDGNLAFSRRASPDNLQIKIQAGMFGKITEDND